MKRAATTVLKTFLLFVAALMLSPFCQAQDSPRAVSLDYCADQFLLALADRGQIMALSRDAVAPHSYYRARAQGLPLFGATAEEVLHMAPDIVIRNWGGFTMLPFLKQAGIPVVTARYGAGPDILFDNMLKIGAALGQEPHAQQMIDSIRQRLAEIKVRAAHSALLNHRLRTAYIAPGGITAGKNTFVDNIIKLAGLLPVAEQLGLDGWQPLPLEALIQNPPDLIITSFFNQDDIHISGWSLTRHHRIRKMLDSIPTIMVPGRYLSCNGGFTAEAAAYIQNEVERLFK